jgi:hypothetical protein
MKLSEKLKALAEEFPDMAQILELPIRQARLAENVDASVSSSDDITSDGGPETPPPGWPGGGPQ